MYEIATAQVDPNLVAEIAAAAGLPLEVARILAHRAGSLEEAVAWLKPLENELSDPFSFSNMDKAIERIVQAIRNQESIVVYGDYDVDGISATVVMLQALEAWGANVSPFFPDRFEEGYGLSIAALERCLDIRLKRQLPPPQLFVTVDCGITSVKEVAWLKDRHIDVVVTDHHMPLEVLPDAVAIVNPRLAAHPRAAEASGCATAFAVVRALEKVLIEPPVATAKTTPPLAALHRTSESYVDLVAVSIISDVMMLTGDNRTLVLRGLQMLTQALNGNAGLKALLDVLKLRKPNVTLTSERIAFSICPCINAAGRLGREALKEAFRLLMLPMGSQSLQTCAQTLLAFNEKRRKIEHELTQYIETTTALIPNRAIAIAGAGEIFHPGVIGIVAARLMERLQAPVAVIVQEKGGGHGSMRAGEGYNAIDILRYLEAYLDHFGGHAQAAGFTIKEGCCEAFCQAFSKACEATREDMDERPYIVDIDLAMIPITLPLCTALTRLEPYGHGNPRPLFVKRFELRSKRVVGADGTHLSLFLRPDDGGIDLKAVWFNGVELAKDLNVGDNFCAIFSLDLDTYNPMRPLPSVRIVHVI